MTRRLLSLVVAVVMLITICAGDVLANGPHDGESDLRDDIATYVRNWVFEHYSEHYNLSGYSGEVAEMEIEGEEFRALVPMVVSTTLKYSSAESLPYVEGIRSALNVQSLKDTLAGGLTRAADVLSSANPHLSAQVAQNVVAMLADQYSDIEGCIGSSNEMSLDFVVIGRVPVGETRSLSLFVSEMGGELIDATRYIPHGKEALESDGRSDMLEYMGKAEAGGKTREPSVGYYASYDRIAARNYALRYTSNATSYCNCGTNYGIDYSYWNNTEYPYFDNACHSDCADFVSQAMHAGGIPIDPGQWERLNDSNNNWAWTYIPGLTAYMTTQTGYWDSSTYAACNAGNILLMSSSHVVMVTYNDTVTHRYSAHTRDRMNYQFTHETGYVYYTIKTS